MLLIGLTGSVGMGKSAVASRLRARDIPVCDADALVHQLYEGAAVAPIEAAFPGTTGNGKVDRVKLGQAVLGDKRGLQQLEAIVHPLVHAEERAFLIAAFERGAPMAVLEIPLLFETGGNKRVDVTIVVSASADVQKERVLQRPGMTAARLDSILARQMPDAEKRHRADFIVDTSGTLESSYAQVDAIVDALRGRGGEAFERDWR